MLQHSFTIRPQLCRPLLLFVCLLTLHTCPPHNDQMDIFCKTCHIPVFPCAKEFFFHLTLSLCSFCLSFQAQVQCFLLCECIQLQGCLLLYPLCPDSTFSTDCVAYLPLNGSLRWQRPWFPHLWILGRYIVALFPQNPHCTMALPIFLIGRLEICMLRHCGNGWR